MFNLKHTLTTLTAAAFALLLGTSAAPAQSEGHVMLSAFGSKGGLSWLGLMGPVKMTGGEFNCIKMDTRNTTVVAALNRTWPAPPSLVRYVPGGAMTTLATLPYGYTIGGIAIDQDGSYVTAGVNGLFRVRGRTLSTLKLLSGGWSCIDRDDRTGDFMIGSNTGRLLRIDRLTGAASTFATGLGDITGVAYNPTNGTWVVSRAGLNAAVLMLWSNGALFRTIPLRLANGVTVDEKRGDIYATSLGGLVVKLSSSGFTLSSRNYGMAGVSGIDIFGDQNVSLAGSGVVGSQMTVNLRFTKSKNMPYCCALSLGQRPAIKLADGRYLNLKPDSLFQATACANIPGLTQGFVGMTSSVSGFAVARFTIPTWIAVGQPIYIGAVAVNPNFANNLDVANVEVVKPWKIRIPRP